MAMPERFGADEVAESVLVQTDLIEHPPQPVRM